MLDIVQEEKERQKTERKKEKERERARKSNRALFLSILQKGRQMKRYRTRTCCRAARFAYVNHSRANYHSRSDTVERASRREEGRRQEKWRKSDIYTCRSAKLSRQRAVVTLEVPRGGSVFLFLSTFPFCLNKHES